MSWVADSAAAQPLLATVVKQQEVFPASDKFATLPENNVLRVYQLDALQAQTEIVDILRNSLFEIFNLDVLQPFRYAHQDEFLFLLDVILYWGSTWRRAQSVGDRMGNLVLRDERKALESGQLSAARFIPSLFPSRGRLFLHAILTVFVPYIVRKLQRRSLEEDWERGEPGTTKAMVARLVRRLSILWFALSFFHTLHFLATARYRTLVERLLALRLVHGSQRTRRFTNLMYLDQHTMWQTWSSLFAVLNVGRYFGRIMRSLQAFTSPPGGSAVGDNVCCACNGYPTIGQRSNCGHLYCYYCIKSRLMDPRLAGSFRCLRCGTTVYDASPL